MAELVVGAVVTVVIEKLLAGELMKFARSEGIDSQLKEWKRKLPLIQAVLADAGHKEITQRAVEMWLIELQDVAYDIDDVLDDIATQVMRRKLNHGTTTSKVIMNMIPTCCTNNNFTPHNLVYGREIRSKLDEITARLHDLFQQKIDLGLNVNVEISSRTIKPLEETSLVNESEILGWGDDKRALLDKLLGDEASNFHKNVKIVSIVGLGGVGKTTLAKILYHDEQVKGHFELRAWVCVSDDFDVFNVSKVIYQAICGKTEEFSDLNLLHEALQKKLSNKRFLLVLDDVWNQDPDKWQVLKQPLAGAPGSKVIVTTRSTEVALVMNSVHRHNLGVLSDEVALSLFAHYALEEQNFDKHPSLKPIAQGIVKKCDGLPLALVTIGRVLKTKGIDVVEWEALLNSEIWGSHDASGILPALKLSYYHLPPHLKQVFAYCSMFPKKTEFEKKKLILLWMAQGFLAQPDGNKQPMESLGDTYFKELLSRSFFRPIANDESLFTMHDLLNDLAASVARDFFFRLDDNMDLNDRTIDFKMFRHFSFIDEKIAEYTKFKEVHRVRCLRTFLLLSIPWQILKEPNSVILELLPKLAFVRVLSLSDCLIKEVPQSVGSLKHLRYLDFSNTDIERIPEQVSELYNLQSLLVCGCLKLSSLPVSFVKLINLRHLDMTHTRSLKKLPLGMGGLTSLQTLSKVVIQEDNGFKISELRGLKDLQGKLSIKGLENVIDPTEAKDANLQQKKGIDDLALVWSKHDSRDLVIEYEVLERLRGPHNLKKLKIRRYGGKEFPNWVGHLSSLKRVTLAKCHLLESYSCPTNVESLDIEDCDSLRSLSFSKMQKDLPSSSSSSSSSFSSNLKILRIQNCKNISSIYEDHLPSLVSLEEMWICKCPSMEDSFPSSSGGLWPPNLRKLTIGELKKPVSEWGLQYCPTTLVELELNGRDSGVGSLGTMEEQDYNNTLPPNLRQLRIVEYHSLKSYCCPNNVEKLDIWKCSSMTSLTFSRLKEDRPPSSSANLKIILINDCENLKSISQEHLQSLTSLELMWILDCPSMEDSFPSYELLWPPNLKTLRIGGLKKPMSEWGIQNYPPSLVRLMLEGKNSGVVSFGIMEEHEDHNNTPPSGCFLLPQSLTSLEIVEFEQVESVSEVLQRLPHLQRLDIWRCPKLDVPVATSYLEVYVH